jgi:hypothetical protein
MIFLECLRTGLCNECSMICSFEFLTRFTLGACNFFISDQFLMIVNVSVKRRGSSFVSTQKTMEPSPWIQSALEA